MGGRSVLVVGGGVMGAATAWQLAVRGVAVTLVEQFEPGHDRGASHGSSRIFRLAYPQGDYVALAGRALYHWRRLEAETGTSLLTLTGGVDHGSVDAIMALHATLGAAHHRSELLTAQQARGTWPWLRFDSSVLFHPDAGRVHADLAVAALHEAARARGVRTYTGDRAVAVATTSTGVRATLGSGIVLGADALVVAAGAWTAELLDGVVTGLPRLTVTQEQPVHFPSAVAPDDWPSFIHHHSAPETGVDAVYGLGSADGVKVGAHGVGRPAHPDRRDRSVDPVALAAVQDYAADWLPGVDHTRPSAVTCLYTSTPDSDFVIDRQGPVTVLAGFSGHGFKFAPAIGALAAELSLDDTTTLPRFALDRANARSGAAGTRPDRQAARESRTTAAKR